MVRISTSRTPSYATSITRDWHVVLCCQTFERGLRQPGAASQQLECPFAQYATLDCPGINPAAATQPVLPRSAAAPASRDETLLDCSATPRFGLQMPRGQRPQGPSQFSQMGRASNPAASAPRQLTLSWAPCEGPKRRLHSLAPERPAGIAQ